MTVDTAQLGKEPSAFLDQEGGFRGGGRSRVAGPVARQQIGGDVFGLLRGEPEARHPPARADRFGVQKEIRTPPRHDAARLEVRGFEPPPAEIAAPLHVAPIAPGPEPVLADETIVAPEADEALAQTVALTLDIVAMQERYPLLRNAL